ncbi:TPA: DUF4145 domain-containing protein [Streptococcus pyogenes]|uniref:DUF4145 domain-containing protein n=1 Tax=Streptococcus pyogenes TaxID=1314 RepID=UPI00022CAE9D|nr:DUF4145 domain-containing protein [Streptococcus pyogenes]ERL19574.1 PF13643 domain protein [Streptococcus pyogenes GA06023]QBX28274.1 hypothetical protein Javan446_0060 [Streptococcus phage Javan446]HER4572120.1 DUF4145 domain-containing protein [Streptococcus pyogenes NGAS641]HER4601507.1 DUF4145 domain-containing protein [Streptococcus pyogenes NGAS625]HER4629922.1 DUF4145 domain-containing protein [Streptococcus pyogenes NGAS599]HER4700730.1 DUF4145 domain-containing protein [Streptoco
MLVKAKYSDWGNAYVNVSVTDICPNCGRGIEPIVKDTSFYKDDSSHILFLTLFCNACKHAWVDSFDYDSDYASAWPKHWHQYREIPTDLPKELQSLSAQGTRTYIQAIQAEIDGYDTLVGIGLRKALEFFLKDFLILTNPDNKEDIQEKQLGKVITNYIQEPSLLSLARATTWLGNDETHYVRKHTDQDLQDLKKFLKATIRFLEYQLTIIDAHEFVNRPKKS